MKTLTFVEAGKIAFHEREAPSLGGPGEALVRPLAVSRCDLDFVFARGKAPIAGPFALGHECVAEVVEVGPEVTSVAAGDRVIVPFQVSCGACARCRKGRTSSCLSVPKLASYGLGPLSSGEIYGGAIADMIRVPFADAMLVKLDPRLSPIAAAALADNAVDGFRTVRDALAREPGSPVLVAAGGAPSIALYAVSAARALGASEVVYVDPSAQGAEIAAALGARVVREKATSSLRIGRFPITVDATGRAEGLRFCLSSTDAWGECTSIGIYFQDVAMPLFDMYTRGIRFVTGRVDARAMLPEALALAAEGSFAIEPIVTKVVGWEEAPSAWVEPAVKLVVARGEAGRG
ncbi:Alcohol dehydrogenase [Minicystis rosea]|nr:Alcohol dehydrogenase [Minicystis rosea]